MRYIGVIAALAIVPAMAVASKPSKEPIDIGPQPTFEVMQAAMEAQTKAHLVDPDSAKFRFPFEVVSQPLGWSMCAEVNAKNRMGGYNGYKTLLMRMVQGKVTFWNMEDEETGDVRSWWCAKMPAREIVSNQ